jgi:putative flippase GtrA/SAM-dependent methyltransferase
MNRSAQFTRFGAIGALGFLVDAGLLTLLVNGYSWGHYRARLLSFAAAASATWYANRRHTFRATDNARTEYTRYLAVQVVGAAINLAVYVALIEAIPPLARFPAVPLAIGAGVALMFNFVAAKRLVFAAGGPPSAVPAGAPATLEGYSGRDNLEAMEHARNYNDYLLGLLRRYATSGRILDFGAGTGTFARQLAGAGCDVVCVEPDGGLRARLEARGLVAVASLADVPPDSIDFIYSFNVLEHIEDDRSALAALRDRLKPGGRLLLYVPAFELLFSAMDRKVGHFRRYRRRDLAGKLAAAGLEVSVARYADSLGFFATLLYKVAGDSSGSIDSRGVSVYDSCVFPVSRRADYLFGPLFGKNLLALAARKRA